MTDRDFRLLTARISLTAPIGKKPAPGAKPARPRLGVPRPALAKSAR